MPAGATAIGAAAIGGFVPGAPEFGAIVVVPGSATLTSDPIIIAAGLASPGVPWIVSVQLLSDP